jgi:hypothetical protein
LAVFAEVSLAFIPFIREQNDFRRAASFLVLGFGAGGFKFIPCFFADARPLALRPPFSDLPSFLCHAGVLGTMRLHNRTAQSHKIIE